MKEQIERLEQDRDSAWATGLSDEPPSYLTLIARWKWYFLVFSFLSDDTLISSQCNVLHVYKHTCNVCIILIKVQTLMLSYWTEGAITASKKPHLRSHPIALQVLFPACYSTAPLWDVLEPKQNDEHDSHISATKKHILWLDWNSAPVAQRVKWHETKQHRPDLKRKKITSADSKSLTTKGLTLLEDLSQIDFDPVEGLSLAFVDWHRPT